MPTALVTGATSGIGAAFARQLARKGFDLVLVARNADRLRATADELSAGCGVRVEALPADLSETGPDGGCARVEERLAARVDLLVNNAGFTTHAPFDAGDRDDEERMLAVNVRAVLRLAHAALPPMLAAGSGSIVNVSSVAGFFPTAGGPTYAASKAYVTALSEGMAVQYASRGVSVMALCPGFTRTEFHARAGISTGGISDRLWLDADQLVASALADLRRGRSISIPGAPYKAAVSAGRLVPKRVLDVAARRVSARRGRH
jgi:short-subunit dehydrogenase